MARPDFTVVLRGYNREEVDAYVTQILAIEAGSIVPLSPAKFRVGMRGYDRVEVDQYIRGQAARFPQLIPM
jgi:cell division septum initiation protein DivIVA